MVVTLLLVTMCYEGVWCGVTTLQATCESLHLTKDASRASVLPSKQEGKLTSALAFGLPLNGGVHMVSFHNLDRVQKSCF